MVVGIHQPHYFPWIGYFDKMAKSDRFILLDEVQMEKGSFMYRNRIINCQGKIVYLTISGDKHGYLEKKYRDIESTNDNECLKKQKNEIIQAYKESNFFDEIWNHLGILFETEETTICNYCIRSIFAIKDLLGIDTKIFLQSDLHYDETQKKNNLVLDLCKAIGANEYLSGNGARKYTDEASYLSAGITLRYQDFHIPEYDQIHTNEFIPGLSILDMLFNCGIERTKQMFWNESNKRQEFLTK